MTQHNESSVLFLSPQPFFEWRGSPIRVLYDLKTLSEMGFSVDLITMPVGEDKIIPKVKIHRLINWFGITSLPIGISFKKFVLDFFLLCKALQLSFQKRYDVIVGVEDAGIIAYLASKIRGSKCVFEKHSDYASYLKAGHHIKNTALWLYGCVEKFVIRHADAIIVTGPGLAEQTLSIGLKNNVFTIHDPPSSDIESGKENENRVRERLQIKSGECVIMYVGSFAIYQGINLLFESIPHVLTRCTNAKWIVIGGSEEEINKKKEWLRTKGVQDHVSFTGKVAPEKLPEILSISDILLSPRISGENTPLKLLDYLKAGKTIIATDIKANRWIVDENTALLVKPEPESFARGIIQAIENEPLRRNLGENARKLYEQKFSFTEFKKKMKECYLGH
ncbi:MAG: glycosyltransferase family 4 protein [Candidatus Aureabacteria bacterium]|nr:glycosyltransferase family 4 protein [Candidatus Auribacterota bacterium]